ncbi:hypothetical protein R8Z50_12055 [Longispora sp. K20-0274]|uniref:hypothetical protein n=1 Tax=Longispora sp. K20-0274 TaxID=3088255 RepID=UPI00399AD4F9
MTERPAEPRRGTSSLVAFWAGFGSQLLVVLFAAWTGGGSGTSREDGPVLALKMGFLDFFLVAALTLTGLMLCLLRDTRRAGAGLLTGTMTGALLVAIVAVGVY